MFGLTKLVRPNTWKTKILHLSIDRIWNYLRQNITYLIQPLTYWPKQQHKYGFNQVEFVNKNSLEAQNPRRDTNIMSVCTGFIGGGSVINRAYPV